MAKLQTAFAKPDDHNHNPKTQSSIISYNTKLLRPLWLQRQPPRRQLHSKCEELLDHLIRKTRLYESTSLAVGSAVGSIRELFAKVKAIDTKHGKFEFLLCLGDFFGPEDVHAAEGSVDIEMQQLLEGKLEGMLCKHILRLPYKRCPSVAVPMPCYIMQGDQPLPQKVVNKFASSGSEICPDVFLMSKFADSL